MRVSWSEQVAIRGDVLYATYQKWSSWPPALSLCSLQCSNVIARCKAYCGRIYKAGESSGGKRRQWSTYQSALPATRSQFTPPSQYSTHQYNAGFHAFHIWRPLQIFHMFKQMEVIISLWEKGRPINYLYCGYCNSSTPSPHPYTPPTRLPNQEKVGT